jgi:lipopolysaccharide export system protein LptA
VSARRTPIVLLAALLLSCTAVSAQENKGSPLQGLSMNKDQPVKIEAATLEVRDKQRQATFSGGVKLTQGDTVLKCKMLVVFYEDTAAAPQAKKGAAPAPAAGPGGNQQIKRAEARGDVIVTQKDQTATGENGIFDLKSNTVTLTGNVVVTQGQNVMRGDKMVVELTTGVVRVESGKGTRPVEMVLSPGATNAPLGAPKDAKQNPAPAQPKSTPRQPIKIN